MDVPKTFQIVLTKRELEILIQSTGSASPTLDNELEQYRLYHKLVSKLNETQ